MVVLACFGIPLSHSEEYNGEYYEPLWPGSGVFFKKLWSQYIFGDVSDATVETTEYDQQNLLWILEHIKEELGDSETTIIEETNVYNIVGNIYGFERTFEENKNCWNVPFASGKVIDPNGTFLCTIWGMSWSDYSYIWGPGHVKTGIQFRLDDGVWPAGVIGKGLFQLIDSVDAISFHDFSLSDAVGTPKDTPNESFGLVKF